MKVDKKSTSKMEKKTKNKKEIQKKLLNGNRKYSQRNLYILDYNSPYFDRYPFPFALQ